MTISKIIDNLCLFPNFTYIFGNSKSITDS